MKVKAKGMQQQERMATLDALYTAAGSIRGRDATKLFLRDLLTESERIMLGRRILIARLLLSGATYAEVSARLGVGADTISRIDRWLSDKAPGYEIAIKGLEREKAKRVVGKNDLFSNATWRNVIRDLKRKYPIHFLLFPSPKSHE